MKIRNWQDGVRMVVKDGEVEGKREASTLGETNERRR